MAIEDLRQRDWVLLPGTLCTTAVFKDFLDTLEIPIDRRKHVRLDMPEVEAYADVLSRSVGDPVLCGFSLGAIVAAHHAYNIPVARTVLFALNPFPDDPAKAEGRLDLERDVRVNGGRTALAARLPALFGPAPEKTRDRILTMADESAADIRAHTALALTRPSALPALSRTRSPVVALTGSEDAVTPEALGRHAANTAREGRFKLVPGLGHYAVLEAPQICAEAFIEVEKELP